MRPPAKASRSRWALGGLLVAIVPLLGAAWRLSDSGAMVSRPLAWEKAADRLRHRDCAAALTAVDALAANAVGQDAVLARLAGGFYARACGRADLAEARLRAIAAPGGLLEDWRLWELAQASTEVGRPAAAEASLARLIGDYPASPLRPRALLAAAKLARDRGDAQNALALAEVGRRTPAGSSTETDSGPVKADAGTVADLEALAWQVATAAGDAAERARSARRLLVEFPLRASELSVIESFRAPDGRIDWAGILTGSELTRRARTLLGLGLLDGAATALAAVPGAERDLAWSLLEAEVETRSFRGVEAYASLVPITFRTPAQEAALEWARARAADDAATVRRGRPGPNAAERADLRQRQRRHLLRVVQLASDRALSQKALKILFEQFTAEEATDRALASLRELRRLDPSDTTGATLLWGRGWQEYGRANHTGAIGWWTELVSIYPNETSARSARYWTARSFERLGETERSRQIYREVAGADTADFYRRNALARLGEKSQPKSTAAPGAVGSESASGAWPTDPTLSRARLLSDYGLDSLAGLELDLVSDRAAKRPLAALRAVILARQGDRRKSVLAIRDAFPALGGPFQASVPEEAQQLYYPVAFKPQVEAWALAHRLPVDVVYGMIRQESAFDLSAQSHVGARGLMQLMPATAREISRRFGIPFSIAGLDEPDLNVRLGTAYFRQMLDTFDGNLELSLAGYNAGPNRIRRLWKNSPAQETDAFVEGLALSEPKIYVKRILILSDSYRRLYSSANAG